MQDLVGVADGDSGCSILSQKGWSLVSTSLVKEHSSLPLQHEIPALLHTSNKDHDYKCTASSANVWCKEFLPSSVPIPMYCHNCGAVTGASYAGTASERKRFVITCKKESALSNLWALVCICMFLRLWMGMISFTWALVTRAGLWAYCLIRCWNAVTAGLFITSLVVYFFFLDLENIYSLFTNQNCYP